ncbi:MBL fold metallo-hydrolase [Fulvivirga sedimenti]|uniref:MBL fold metallo-hydrolase n=1 Tax=Fulvivirga sedimenti TaxID=2879465 RepID=A0A9X1HU14_9BACT|nr:MBL fold metallo-hydrolase [Fulvivirga sedimenti]MCA6074985.1 MBL fold metallo-hydrolase [Fulvivirga sedimenti]MCA6076162.1 MBL fold metallo-hydrolase [Fulvivirga sedimenti]MCA6077290.1 MBL fold metallo-hydrolase [Fulvivirga sedimenti]
MDTSWWIKWDDTVLILDPWLIGSEVDGFSWFNEQWHATPPVPIGEIGNYDAIIVSQSYSDHCHGNTLKAMEKVPVCTTPSARKRVEKETAGNRIEVLQELGTDEWLEIGDVELAYLDPGRKLDPIYNGIVIRKGKKVVVYFPHGFTLNPKQLRQLRDYEVELLITSFSLFKLPAFLGGAVNPGKENAIRLVNELGARKVVHTHDENKHARGLVKKIARVVYPDPEDLRSILKERFEYLQYETLEL